MYLKLMILADIFLLFIIFIILFPLFLFLTISMKNRSKLLVLFKSILQINILKENRIYSFKFIETWIAEITQFLQKYFPTKYLRIITIPLWDIFTIYQKSTLCNKCYFIGEFPKYSPS